MRGHKNDSYNTKRKNYQVNNAIIKYGWNNIKKEIILTCDEKDIDSKEIEYIKIFNATNRESGYNRELGGNLKKQMSKETKILMSKSKKGSVVWSKPVLQINAETGETIKRWESMHDASRELNIAQSSISNVCSKKVRKIKIKGKEYFSSYRKTGGFKWSFCNN